VKHYQLAATGAKLEGDDTPLIAKLIAVPHGMTTPLSKRQTLRHRN